MLIRLGYDIEFDIFSPTAFIAQLRVHPSRVSELLEPDFVQVNGNIATHEYTDTFGNLCTRFNAQPGHVRIFNSTLIDDQIGLDPEDWNAREIPIPELPDDVLRFLLNSRYCEVDLLTPTAVELFGNISPGWNRVQAICNWVNAKVTFNYMFARPTKTALDVYTERIGVCRDYQHLAVTFCRCLGIPARYVAGYLGDIGVPLRLPMDFSAWFEVYLDHKWWAFDARNNTRRLGRILMATGRDAADVAFLTSFGSSSITKFEVVSDEVVVESSASLTS